MPQMISYCCSICGGFKICSGNSTISPDFRSRDFRIGTSDSSSFPDIRSFNVRTGDSSVLPNIISNLISVSTTQPKECHVSRTVTVTVLRSSEVIVELWSRVVVIVDGALYSVSFLGLP